MGEALPLLFLDLVGHAVEGLERRGVGEAGHGLVDAPLRLSPLLLGDEQVPLPLRLLDLVVELPQGALELLGLRGLGLPGLLQHLSPLRVLLLAHERLLGQVVAAFFHGQHRAVLPVPRLLHLVLELRFQLALVGDGRRDLALGLRQLVPHVQDDLVQHLLGVFGPRDHVVDVRLDHRGQLVEDAHVVQPSASSPARARILFMCPDAAISMESTDA
jgi:hypothetical protein